MIRKFIAGASAAAVLLSLLSCGGNGARTETADTEDGGTERDTESASFESELELPLINPFEEEETE